MSAERRPVPWFERYQVDTDGQVYLLSGEKAHTPPDKVTGYVNTSFRKDGKNVCKLVHRIVAETFLPNPEGKPYVNHKNGIKHDNRLENLEWSTASENSKHAHERGLLRVRKGVDSPLAKWDVDDIRLMHQMKRQGMSGAAIARYFGAGISGINRILRGARYKVIT